jgi:hypothetical protein
MSHRIPFLALIGVVLAVFGGGAFFIGGSLAGWKIIEHLTSPLALFIYFIALIVLLYFIIRYLFKRDSR